MHTSLHTWARAHASQVFQLHRVKVPTVPPTYSVARRQTANFKGEFPVNSPAAVSQRSREVTQANPKYIFPEVTDGDYLETM